MIQGTTLKYNLQGTTEIVLLFFGVLRHFYKIPICSACDINGVITRKFAVTSLVNKLKASLYNLGGLEIFDSILGKQ